MFGLFDGIEEVVEFLFAGEQEFYLIVGGDGHAGLLQVVLHDLLAFVLCVQASKNEREYYNYDMAFQTLFCIKNAC